MSITSISYIIFVILLLLSYLTFKKDRSSFIVFLLALCIFTVAGMTFSSGLAFDLAHKGFLKTSTFFIRLAGLFLFLCFFSLFRLALGFKNTRFFLKLNLLFLGIFLVIGFLILFTDFYVSKVVIKKGIFYRIEGCCYKISFFFIFISGCISVFLLLKKRKKTNDSLLKSKLLLIVIAIISGFVSGPFFGVFIPLIFKIFNFYPLGVSIPSLMSGILIYASCNLADIFVLKSKKSIKKKVIFIIILVFILFTALPVTSNISQFHTMITNRISQEALLIGGFIKRTIKKMFKVFGRIEGFEEINTILKKIVEEHEILNYCRISDKRKLIIYTSSSKKTTIFLAKNIYTAKILDGKIKTVYLDKYIEIILPVFNEQGKPPLTNIHLGVEKKLLLSKILPLILKTIMIFFSTLVFSIFLLLYFVAKKVLNPITSLTFEMQNISKSMDLSNKVIIKGEDEIAELGQVFNTMLNRIQNYKNELESLNEISKQVSISPDFESVFNRIFNHLYEKYGFEGCGLSLITPDKKHYKIEISRMPEHLKQMEDLITGQILPLNLNKGGGVAHCILNKTYTYFADTNKISGIYSDLIQIKSVLNIPICIEEEVIGAFTLASGIKNIYLQDEDLNSIERFVDQIAALIRNSKLYEQIKKDRQQLEEAKAIIEEDLIMAERIQANLISPDYKKISKLDIEVFFKPMMKVGGDLFDICIKKENNYRIFMADATGHGIQGALTTMLIKNEYDKLRKLDFKPNVLLGFLNNAFIEHYYKLSVFFTCIIVDIDLNNNIIKYSAAGHPAQYLISSKENHHEITKIFVKGKMVGLLEKMQYKSIEVEFKKHDKLLLFTDGLYEEFTATGEELGQDRLDQKMQQFKDKPIKELVASVLQYVEQWRGDNPINDDKTIIGIEYL